MVKETLHWLLQPLVWLCNVSFLFFYSDIEWYFLKKWDFPIGILIKKTHIYRWLESVSLNVFDSKWSAELIIAIILWKQCILLGQT